MNRQIWIYGLLTIGAIILLALTFEFFPIVSSQRTKEQKYQSISTSKNALNKARDDQVNDKTLGPATTETGKALRSIFKILVEKEAVRVLPNANKYLQDEIASDDKGRILRAFHDIIWSRSWRMSEVIPVLKSFLNDPDPFVRLNAAHDLFIVGDQSGYDALLALVQSSNSIEGLPGADDVRVEAATILAQYKQTAAAPAIYNLYYETKSGDLISALATLGSPQAAALTEARGYFSDASSLAFYGQAGATQFIPQITSTFSSTQNPDVKAAAAWALATMTGDQNATNYLVQIAQTDLNNPSQTGSVSERSVISYLGSIQTPTAKQTLETALTSSDPAIVQMAVTNLVYNQGGSDRAVQVIANQLSNSTQATLPWNFIMNMATQLLDNPKIQSAGQVFSQTDSTGEWQLYTDERRNWSPYNWMGGLYIAKPSK